MSNGARLPASGRHGETMHGATSLPWDSAPRDSQGQGGHSGTRVLDRHPPTLCPFLVNLVVSGVGKQRKQIIPVSRVESREGEPWARKARAEKTGSKRRQKDKKDKKRKIKEARATEGRAPAFLTPSGVNSDFCRTQNLAPEMKARFL